MTNLCGSNFSLPSKQVDGLAQAVRSAWEMKHQAQSKDTSIENEQKTSRKTHMLYRVYIFQISYHDNINSGNVNTYMLLDCMFESYQ